MRIPKKGAISPNETLPKKLPRSKGFLKQSICRTFEYRDTPFILA
jgi:hypothetical protein